MGASGWESLGWLLFIWAVDVEADEQVILHFVKQVLEVDRVDWPPSPRGSRLHLRHSVPMRVIAGSAKGVRLASVPAGTRPTSDRAREGLFSSFGPDLEGLRVLDLFAGTGAMGIEALSRGAVHATFVDSAPAAIRAIEENLRRTKLAKSATVRRTDALRAVRSKPGPFELVFADPPYAIPVPELDRLLAETAGQGVVSAGGRVILTRGKRSYTPVIPVHWRLDRRLSYGDTTVLVLVAQ